MFLEVEQAKSSSSLRHNFIMRYLGRLLIKKKQYSLEYFTACSLIAVSFDHLRQSLVKYKIVFEELKIDFISPKKKSNCRRDI